MYLQSLIVLKEIIYSFNEGGDCILETIFYEDTLEEINDVEMLEFEEVEFEHNWVYTYCIFEHMLMFDMYSFIYLLLDTLIYIHQFLKKETCLCC